MAQPTLPDAQQLQALEEKFDPEMRFRPSVPPATQLIKGLLITLSCFHYYTAGFGLLRETTHRGVHLAFVLGLIFLVFSAGEHDAKHRVRHSLGAPGGIPLIDWALGLAGAASVLYIPWVFHDLAMRRPCACGPSIGSSSMPEPLLANSAMAPAGAPPVKKKASSEPSFILSPAWFGLMYSGLISLSCTP